MSKIVSLTSRPILDSRGDWTIEVSVYGEGEISADFSVPQGKSKGSFEAALVSPEAAIKNIKEIIEPALKGMSVEEQTSIDEALITLDATPSKSRLGANAILGVSFAYAKAAALVRGIPFWKYLRELYGAIDVPSKKPSLYINVINGGLHAGNNLSFQEYLIIPKTELFSEAVNAGTVFYTTLREYLRERKGANAINVGDEGGFAPNFENDIEPFEILNAVRAKLDMQNIIAFGIDAAANSILKEPAELMGLYKKMNEEYHLVYYEDPFGENDFQNFSLLKKELGDEVIISGDDLTATNILRMESAKKHESINGIIIKPNQIGTVSETLAAIKKAREYKWKVIVSHRSGETNDDSIADLAYAIEADGIKLGSPCRGERVAKYNRLLEIEKDA